MKYFRSLFPLGVILFLSGPFFVFEGHTLTYVPATTISLTGSNDEVFFDVEDDIVNAGSSVAPPTFSTVTRTFSGAFYLTGAGWVDMGATGYHVSLDCGAQSLDALSLPCEVIGTGYSEIIGDVIFEEKVFFNPSSGILSGTATTYIGDYSMSGIILPLLPAVFLEGTGSIVSTTISLSISGSALYGDGPWTIGFTPVTTTERRDRSPSSSFTIDLSLATDYDVEIEDPQGSITQFRYKASADIPSFTLAPSGYFREDFCIAYSTDGLCQDGDVQKPSELTGVSGSKVANASDAFSMDMSFRDQYGNIISDGDVSISYEDRIRTFQVDPLEYMNFSDYCVRNIDNYCALITGGALINNDDGYPTVSSVPVLGGVSYTIASRAPTSAVDTLSLKDVIYTDTNGVNHTITHPSLQTPLVFTSWFSTSLTSGVITVGSGTDFSSVRTNVTPTILPDASTAIYQINIGTNVFASYTNYQGDGISCTKYIGGASSFDECDWIVSPDTTVISTAGSTFSGVYSPFSGMPGSENVTYKSFIRYLQGGTTVIYPLIAGSLGNSVVGVEYMKLLGQNTLLYSGVGTDSAVASTEWNSLKKNVGLMSRGREDATSYGDVEYIVYTGDITITDADLHSANPKRTIVTIGGDITISENIEKGETCTVLIALSDADGVGGMITIDPSVTELYTSLFAEKSVMSSGDNQLYIFGNVFSRNTLADIKCPYFVEGACDPTLYNLEKIRADYIDLPSKVGHTSAAPRAAEYPHIPLIIEYDGRILGNPPPLLEK